MATWAAIQQEIESVPPLLRGNWIKSRLDSAIAALSTHVQRPVIFYASGFLQKPQVDSSFVSISHEDINAFMSCVNGLDCSRGLLLLIHTPGGSAEAAETIVDYLRSKFKQIDVLIPTYAMSAGTMIALAADRIIMGRQSQLGPTDPQLIMNGIGFSAHSIDAMFDEAKREIAANPRVAAAYVPVLQPFGPALLQEARKAVAYGRSLVAKWLAQYMLKGLADPAATADRIAEFFSGSAHGSHGRRIGKVDASAQGLNVDELEADPALQDLALTLYHIVTVAFDQGPASKLVISTNGAVWVKNMAMAVPPTMPFFLPGMPPPGFPFPGVGLSPPGGAVSPPGASPAGTPAPANPVQPAIACPAPALTPPAAPSAGAAPSK